ncbi:hypothetical protein [Bradyrhizobium sp. BR 1433]|uniref:hypothetical protein n=1 Tax=Bradyrhizobium sp. BR 1433 TaxID=3447967 RepID=UPI003EE49B02
MDPFNHLNPSEIPDVGRTYDEGLQQQQADQAAFQQQLNELHPRELPTPLPNSNRRRPPYAGSNRDADPLEMPHEDRVGQGPSRLTSDPPSHSEQGINQHVLFATADRDSQLSDGSFSLTDSWHDMDAAADWRTHQVDQEQHWWAGTDDVVAEWRAIPASPWEQNLAASVLARQPRPGDGNTGGRRLPAAAAQWTEASHGTGTSTPAPAGDLTNLDAPVLQEARLDRILDIWVGDEGQTEDEDRQEAATRIRAWAEAGDVYTRLDLPDLGLTTLPAAFPPALQSLDVSHNELVHLPDTLPAGLRTLTAKGNRLTSLPNALPTQLQSLEIGSNRLSSLPETLPEGLLTLAVGSCRLTSLPDLLPAGLQDLDVRGNLLTSLPDALPSGLQLLAVGGNRLTNLPDSLPLNSRSSRPMATG